MVKKPFYIVALGASAGGHQALWEYFDHLPTHLPVAFVVILHLKADVPSIADELLAKHTALPVQWASDGQALRPHQIYLLPSAKYMTLQAGRFQLTDRNPADKTNRAIDIFLTSLAQDWDGYSMGIILSGAGSDGTLGALELHEKGGMVMAQEPESAIIASMPQWVIQKDHVEWVATPTQLAYILTRLVNQAAKGPFLLPNQLSEGH